MPSLSLRALCAFFIGGLSALAQQSFTIRTYDLVPAGTNPAIPANPATFGYGESTAGNWSPTTAGNDVTYEGFQIAGTATSHGRLVFNYSAPRDFSVFDRIEVTAAVLPGNQLNQFTLELRSTDTNGTVRRSIWYTGTNLALTRHGDKVIFTITAAPGWSQNGLVVDRTRIDTVILGGNRSNPAQDARLIIRDIRAVNDALMIPRHFADDRIVAYSSWGPWGRVPWSGSTVPDSLVLDHNTTANATATQGHGLYFRYVNNGTPNVQDERDLTAYDYLDVEAQALSGNASDLRVELKTVGGGAGYWTLPATSFANRSTLRLDLRAFALHPGVAAPNLSRVFGVLIYPAASNGAAVRWQFGSLRLAKHTPAQVFTFRRGLNMSHWMAQLNNTYPTFADSARLNDTHLDHIDSLTRGVGGPRAFDHIRIPVAYDEAGILDTAATPPVYTLKATFVSAFSNLLLQARARGLGVILDLHTLPGLAMGEDIAHPLFAGSTTPPKTAAAYQAEAEAVWRALARHFANEGPWLRFELMNEPRYARRLTTGENAGENSYEPMHNRAIAKSQEALRRVIRETNPARTIYVTTNNLGSMFMFSGPQRSQPGYGDGNNEWGVFSTTPTADPYYGWDQNLAYTIHYYEPFDLTHFYTGDTPLTATALQNALSPTGSIHTQFNKLRSDITNQVSPNNYLRQYREIHIGEFGITKAAAIAHGGAYYNHPEYSSVRAHFMHRVREKAEEHGFAWCAWDYLDDDFATFDTKRVNGVVVLDANGAPVREANSAGAALLRP